MDEQTIQSQIMTTFIDKISASADFILEEITQIEVILTSAQGVDKKVEELLKAIGGAADENL